MEFYVGSHIPFWLTHVERPALFVSIVRLRRIQKWRRAAGPWALDSGAFTELASGHGTFRTSPAQYADEVQRCVEEIGELRWVAPQDMMCEPEMVAACGLGLYEHQRRTVDNFLDLRGRLGPLVVPSLQGWVLSDYLECARMYEAVGVDLAAEPVVGLGSVCRRSHMPTAAAIVRNVQAQTGARLHGFGFKTTGLRACARWLASADSMAWSFAARVRQLRLEGCEHRAVLCNNCSTWAYQWANVEVGALGYRPE